MSLVLSLVFVVWAFILSSFAIAQTTDEQEIQRRHECRGAWVEQLKNCLLLAAQPAEACQFLSQLGTRLCAETEQTCVFRIDPTVKRGRTVEVPVHVHWQDGGRPDWGRSFLLATGVAHETLVEYTNLIVDGCHNPALLSASP